MIKVEIGWNRVSQLPGGYIERESYLLYSLVLLIVLHWGCIIILPFNAIDTIITSLDCHHLRLPLLIWLSISLPVCEFQLVCLVHNLVPSFCQALKNWCDEERRKNRKITAVSQTIMEREMFSVYCKQYLTDMQEGGRNKKEITKQGRG